MPQITEGKLQNLRKLSTPKGFIAAAAMDQRGSLLKGIAKEKGVDKSQVTPQMMSEFKGAVTRALTPYASAILLDPEFGLEAAKKRTPNAGLLLAYEKSGYDQTGPGRMPDLLPGWSPRRIKEEGANAVKILLYYTPFEKKGVNERKHDWVQGIGEDCEANDIPFFLEFVGYDENDKDEKGIEYAGRKPEIVSRSMEEFSKDRYKVDVLKVEIPVNLRFVQGTRACKGEFAYTREEAKRHYREAASVTSKSFIYLSAGVSDEEFRESLELANEAAVPYNGVLCGRATWKDGIPVYAKSGVAGLEKWLSDRGVQNIKALNAILEKGARPWFEKYGSQR